MYDPFCTVRRYQHKHALRWVLMFFVLFALWHVSQHGTSDVISSDNGSDCQVCRLAHAPTAGGTPQAIVTAIFVIAQRIADSHSPSPRTFSYRPWLARGPPHT